MYFILPPGIQSQKVQQLLLHVILPQVSVACGSSLELQGIQGQQHPCILLGGYFLGGSLGTGDLERAPHAGTPGHARTALVTGLCYQLHLGKESLKIVLT